MCLRKRVFWSAGSAAARANVINQKSGATMRAYHCPNCLQWHLASK